MRQVRSKTFRESLGQEVVGVPESTSLTGVVEIAGIQDRADLLVELISAVVLSKLARLTPSSKRMTVPYNEEWKSVVACGRSRKKSSLKDSTASLFCKLRL
jgi:hypothetical protein